MTQGLHPELATASAAFNKANLDSPQNFQRGPHILDYRNALVEILSREEPASALYGQTLSYLESTLIGCFEWLQIEDPNAHSATYQTISTLWSYLPEESPLRQKILIETEQAFVQETSPRLAAEAARILVQYHDPIKEHMLTTIKHTLNLLLAQSDPEIVDSIINKRQQMEALYVPEVTSMILAILFETESTS